jgi:hypothetical protein
MTGSPHAQPQKHEDRRQLHFPSTASIVADPASRHLRVDDEVAVSDMSGTGALLTDRQEST